MSEFLKKLQAIANRAEPLLSNSTDRTKSWRVVEAQKQAATPQPERKKGDCLSCAEKRSMSFGALDAAVAIMSGRVPEEIAEARFAVCEICDKVDDKGERLFREVKDKHYCGEPRIGWKVYRDEKESGCGCNLKDKVKFNGSSCPWGIWGAIEKKSSVDTDRED